MLSPSIKKANKAKTRNSLSSFFSFALISFLPNFPLSFESHGKRAILFYTLSAAYTQSVSFSISAFFSLLVSVGILFQSNLFCIWSIQKLTFDIFLLLIVNFFGIDFELHLVPLCISLVHKLLISCLPNLTVLLLRGQFYLI